MPIKTDVYLSVKQAVAWVLLSVLLITVPVVLGVMLYRYSRDLRLSDKAYTITHLVVDPASDTVLSEELLAEILGLSLDQPQNLYAFSSSAAKAKLLQFPLIKEASVSKLLPGSLVVRYRVRTPVALLGDYENLAVDMDGVIFPITFLPKAKDLPRLFLAGLPLSSEHLGKAFLSGKMQLALSVLDSVKEHLAGDLVSVDVSKAFALSAGQREIVVSLANPHHVLRLNLLHFLEGLKNYKRLSSELVANAKFQHLREPLVVDLRINQLAFLSY